MGSAIGLGAAEGEVEVGLGDRLDQRGDLLGDLRLLLGRGVEGRDLIGLAGPFRDDRERAVGGDLVVLVGVARLEVLQRLVLGDAVDRRPDGAGNASNRLLQSRGAFADGRQRLVQAVDLRLRGLDVTAQDGGIVRVSFQAGELALHLFLPLLLQGAGIAKRAIAPRDASTMERCLPRCRASRPPRSAACRRMRD